MKDSDEWYLLTYFIRFYITEDLCSSQDNKIFYVSAVSKDERRCDVILAYFTTKKDAEHFVDKMTEEHYLASVGHLH